MSFPLASEAAVRADEGWLRQCTHHRRRARRGCSSFRGVAGRQTFLRMGEMHKKVCTGNQRVLRGRKGEVGSRAYTGERGRWTSGSTTRSDLKKDAGRSGCGAAGQGKPAGWPDSLLGRGGPAAFWPCSVRSRGISIRQAFAALDGGGGVYAQHQQPRERGPSARLDWASGVARMRSCWPGADAQPLWWLSLQGRLHHLRS